MSNTIQNFYTKSAFIALLVASCISLVMDTWTLQFFSNDKTLVVIPLLFLLLIAGMNVIIAFMMYKGNNNYVIIPFILYLVQTIGFEFGDWGFMLMFGFSIHISLSISSSLVTINLFAVLIAFLTYKAMQESEKPNKSLKSGAASGTA